MTPSPDNTSREKLRQGVIGLGDHSARKSYYPELRSRLEELERAQAELSAHKDNLERQVAKRTEELRQSNEELWEATRAKDRFLTNMSHELRTPMNSIIGFTALILEGISGPLTDEQARQLRMVNNAGHYLLGMIEEILDLAKVESGEMEPEFGPFSVKSAIDEAVSIIEPQAADKGLSLTAEYCDAPETITSDRQRFLQVLINLMGNAVKFTETGSVSLIASSDGEHLLVDVSDTGPGIDPAYHEYIWQPFHQIAPPSGGKWKGTGLGLSITRELVTLLGGSVTLESTSGSGATFTVRLPLAPVDAH
ncbi:MAG: sensor histidine kinase [Coriobacteriia bacterium]